MEQAPIRSRIKAARTILHEMGHPGALQALFKAKPFKASAAKTESAILCAHPQETAIVLLQGKHREIGKTLLRAVGMESHGARALRVHDRAQAKHSESGQTAEPRPSFPHEHQHG